MQRIEEADIAVMREEYQQSLAVLGGRGHCVYGHYPWDEWERMAIFREMPRELASLGRAVMREAYQHGWKARLQTLCGWSDEGETMIRLGSDAPKEAKFIWEKLLETDGCRGSYHQKTGEWNSWL